MTRILIFVASGCGACHEYQPRFKKLSQPYDIDIHVLNIAHRDGARYMAEFGIRATPTTVVIDGPRERFRRIGNLPDNEIVAVLNRATRFI